MATYDWDTMSEPKQFLSSLARGLFLLESFTMDRPFLSLTDLARITGISKGGVQRITHTLMELGYLERDNSKLFRLGPKMVGIGFTVLASLDIREVAYPYMKELSDRAGLTVNLSILDRTEIIIIERVEKKKVIDLNLRVGTRLPAYCTAAGKAILAFLSEDQREKIVAQMVMKKLTKHTILDQNILLKHLQEIKQSGYSFNNQELTLISRTVGAPLFSLDGQVVGAVSIGDNAALHSEKEFKEKYVPLILELSGKISRMLGWPEEDNVPRQCQQAALRTVSSEQH